MINFNGFRFLLTLIALFLQRDQHHSEARGWQYYALRSQAVLVTTDANCWEWMNAGTEHRCFPPIRRSFLWDALKTKPEAEGLCRRRPDGRKSLAQLFSESPFKGMSIDFERFSDSLPPSTL